MRLNQITLPAIDLALSVQFYQTLGCTLIVDTPHYARFECPEGDSTFSLHAVEQASSAGVVVYFEHDELDALCATLAQSGIEFDSGPRDEPWLWREARLRDPAGNVVCLYRAGANRRYPPWRVNA